MFHTTTNTQEEIQIFGLVQLPRSYHVSMSPNSSYLSYVVDAAAKGSVDLVTHDALYLYVIRNIRLSVNLKLLGFGSSQCSFKLLQ